MCLQAFKTRSYLGVLLLLFLCSPWVFGQDQEEEQEPQPNYTPAEYNEYLKAVEGGPGTLLDFIAANPDAFLTKNYANGQYLGMIKEQFEKGQHEEALQFAEGYLEKVDPNSFAALYYCSASAYILRNWPKAAKYGQAAYDASPETEGLVAILARAYHNGGEMQKAIPLIEQYCTTVEAKECYDLLPTVAAHYAEAKQWDKAADYANQTLEALSAVEKPAGAEETAWKEYVTDEQSKCYTILAKQAYEKKRWPAVEKNHTESLKLNKKDKVRRAESYYYTGMSRWNREMIDQAMESFARGSLIAGTPYAKPCRDQLERLYKGTHNGSLAGLEEFLGRFSN